MKKLFELFYLLVVVEPNIPPSLFSLKYIFDAEQAFWGQQAYYYSLLHIKNCKYIYNTLGKYPKCLAG